jgi:probable rRNA maturation factor
MTATIDISNSCEACWVPAQEQCEEWLNCALRIAGEDRQSNISVSFVSEADSQSLNHQYRGKDKATNVLSFPAEFPKSLRDQVELYPLGDIVICPTIVASEAASQNKDLSTHWAHLTIHGLLHLLGYQHETVSDSQEMEGLEIKAMERLGFPNPYLLV